MCDHLFKSLNSYINKYSVLKLLNIYFNSISSFFNSIALALIYIQQVQRKWAGYTPHRLKTNCCSLSHGRFWMRRWRLDTSHEDWRQQGITLNLVSTRIRQESLSAKLKWLLICGMKWTRWCFTQFVSFVDPFGPENSLLINILCLWSHQNSL